MQVGHDDHAQWTLFLLVTGEVNLLLTNLTVQRHLSVNVLCSFSFECIEILVDKQFFVTVSGLYVGNHIIPELKNIIVKVHVSVGDESQLVLEHPDHIWVCDDSLSKDLARFNIVDHHFLLLSLLVQYQKLFGADIQALS